MSFLLHIRLFITTRHALLLQFVYPLRSILMQFQLVIIPADFQDDFHASHPNIIPSLLFFMSNHDAVEFYRHIIDVSSSARSPSVVGSVTKTHPDLQVTLLLSGGQCRSSVVLRQHLQIKLNSPFSCGTPGPQQPPYRYSNASMRSSCRYSKPIILLSITLSYSESYS